MKKVILIFFLVLNFVGFAQKSLNYKVINTYHIASTGGWDYIAVHDQRLYVSHSNQVNILDKNSGDSLGVILSTNGVHGIAFDDELKQGFTSNGRSNNITVFDAVTNRTIAEIPTGENPDAILYEPFSKTVITCNGRSKDLSVINPKTQKLIATIPIGGKPETAVSDNAGKLYVNNEDGSEIVVVNTKTFKVENHWSIKPGEAPTGLAIDRKSKRLFAGCENKLLMVIDATNGKIISKVDIGDGCDGIMFDAKKGLIFASNGEGTLSIVQEKSANSFLNLGNIATKRGARTLVLDEKSGIVFLPTAFRKGRHTKWKT